MTEHPHFETPVHEHWSDLMRDGYVEGELDIDDTPRTHKFHHNSAVVLVDKEHGWKWGGFRDMVTPELRDSFLMMVRSTYDENEDEVLAEMARNEFSRWSGTLPQRDPSPDRAFSRAGLFDSEGYMAMADYYWARATGRVGA